MFFQVLPDRLRFPEPHREETAELARRQIALSVEATPAQQLGAATSTSLHTRQTRVGYIYI